MTRPKRSTKSGKRKWSALCHSKARSSCPSSQNRPGEGQRRDQMVPVQFFSGMGTRSGRVHHFRSLIMSYFDHFAFGIYPYIAFAVMLIGSWIRYDREQYTWKTSLQPAAGEKGLTSRQYSIPYWHHSHSGRSCRRPADTTRSLALVRHQCVI